RMDMCELDETGRPSFKPIEASHFRIDADLFIEAIGQGPNPLLIQEIPRIQRGKRGNVVTDEDGATSIPRVFAGGDVATGAATVILAMGAAKRAAKAIDAMLQNSREISNR
ncbi:MAG TPA: FAD-dependent oxidoreductase, partial [Methanomicrobiales archaeon]|nr:FAD-dependent oxidoreductase [Methanomicrobiales archaeon]